MEHPRTISLNYAAYWICVSFAVGGIVTVVLAAFYATALRVPDRQGMLSCGLALSMWILAMLTASSTAIWYWIRHQKEKRAAGGDGASTLRSPDSESRGQ